MLKRLLIFFLLLDAGLSFAQSYSWYKMMGAPGAEDITIDTTTGTVFISCDDRRCRFKKHSNNCLGEIFALQAQDTIPKILPLALKFSQEHPFHPHGIAFKRWDSESATLAVINHRSKKQTTIEVFDYKNKQLIHKQTLENSTFLRSPNDITIAGKNTFLITNDHYSTKSFGQLWEGIWHCRKANVVIYHQGEFQVLIPKLLYPNGITLDSSGKYLFVSLVQDKCIRVYSRNPKTQEVVFEKDIRLGTSPDNIEWDSFGNLWVACHPKPFKFIQHAYFNKTSPSQILKIEGIEGRVQEIYYDSGNFVSGASTAAPWKHKLFIGTVFEPFFLIGNTTKP
ncbi:MAG: SMP-30/gluconolactonase/LRE family protein [Bacteroidia bacterium]|nr:SMP-30/gluconolactonase/LRE family protein [Bacteroidia bacterium]